MPRYTKMRNLIEMLIYKNEKNYLSAETVTYLLLKMNKLYCDYFSDNGYL